MHPIWYLAFFSALVAVSNAYSKGAPDTACVNMKPEHGYGEQKGKFTYKIGVSDEKIAPGGKVKVTISGGSFLGFLVQARVRNTLVPVGHFDEATGAKLIDCKPGLKNSITHSSKDEKKSVVLTWNAPRDLSEVVEFWVTVVQNGKTYWIQQKSTPVQVGKL